MGRGRDGTESIDQALGIALDADLQEAAGLAYSNLQEAASRLNMFAQAERYFAEGRAYCEERELGVYSVCLQGWRAVTLALLGQWAEATDISAQVLDSTRISPVNRLNPLRILGASAVVAAKPEPGTCWTRRSSWPRGSTSRCGSYRCGRHVPN